MEEKLQKEKEEKALQEVGKETEEKPDDEDAFDENDDGGTIEGENEIPEQVIEVHPSVESSTKAQLIESTEMPQTSSINVYEQDENLQSIEPHVEIKYIGASGHLIHSVD